MMSNLISQLNEVDQFFAKYQHFCVLFIRIDIQALKDGVLRHGSDKRLE